MLSGGWQQLTLQCHAAAVEHIGAILDLAGPETLTLPVDADAPCTIQALFTVERSLDSLIPVLRAAGAERIEVSPVVEQDWLATSRAAWQPMYLGAGIWLGPSWCRAPADASLYLCIEPGQAFGTGQHPTTRLCLQWLVGQAEHVHGHVIDYGCGSGVLAIVAARLGAERVTATDIDPLCLAAATENAAANDVAGLIRVVAPAELAGPPARILLANILLRPLLALAPHLAGLVATGGHIVLSGIMRNQVAECRSAYEPWFDFIPPRFEDDWALLCGRRRAEA